MLVLDSSKELEEEDFKLLDLTKEKPRIILANKTDLYPKWKQDNVIYISAKNKTGFELIADKIYEITRLKEFNVDNDKYLNNQRQISLMQRAYKSLYNARMAIKNKDYIDLIEIDIKEAFDALGEITGQSYPEELITALFTKFCLGK